MVTVENDAPLLALPAPPPPPSSSSSNNETATHSTSSSYSSVSNRAYDEKQGPFVGLSNQGATCYLNSLIQTLYMTPEVRKLLYRFQYDREKHGVEETCIPLQLQRLFGRLQLGYCRAVSTTDLTKSFGWNERQSFEQHDVQELCRLLFDAVDKYMAEANTNQNEASSCDNAVDDSGGGGDGGGSEGDDDLSQERTKLLVSDLYTGSMVDYIQSKQDRNEHGELVGRERIDKYMDIQLVIRDMSSVEEALDNFVVPETMDGDNMWLSEELNRKVEAIKGLRFQSPLPYILTLHLKRFDYDYTTWQRIKLSNRISFPFVLDMSKYVNEPEGSMLYELFSVMIHSGSATGGHYYAYIKNFGDGKWYNFNDSNVSEITEKDVESMYGAEGSSYKSAYASTNAYMLMYRKVDKHLMSAQFPDDLEVPDSVRSIVALERELWEKERLEWIDRTSKITAILHFADEDKYRSLRVELRKQHTLADALHVIADAIKQEYPNDEFCAHLTRDLIRLREYKVYDRTAGALMPGQDKDDEREKNLEQLNWNSQQHVFVDFRSSVNEPWSEIREKLSVFVTVLDPKLQLFHEGQIMKLDNCKLDEFLERLTNEFKRHLKDTKEAAEATDTANTVDFDDPVLQSSNIHIILSEMQKYSTVDLTDLNRKASEAGIKDTGVLYVEYTSPESSPVLLEKIEEKDNEITLYYIDTHSNEDIANGNTSSSNKQQPLQIDKRKTWLHLRERLAEKLGREMSEFRICDRHNKLPYRVADDNILSAHVFEYTVLYIEDAPPLTDSERIVKLFRFTPPRGVDSSSSSSVETSVCSKGNNDTSDTTSPTAAESNPIDEPSSKRLRVNGASDESVASDKALASPPSPPPPPPMPSNGTTIKIGTHQSSTLSNIDSKTPFTALGNITVHKDMTLNELKLRISGMVNHPADQLRIRRKFYSVLGESLINNDKSIESNMGGSFEDGSHLSVQLLDHTEHLVEGDRIVCVQRWYSSKWKFGRSFELVVNRHTVSNMGALISTIAGHLEQQVQPGEPALPAHRIAIAKSPDNFKTWTNKECADIPLLDWKNDSTINIWIPPFHLEENDLLFFRDSEEMEKVPLDELKDMFSDVAVSNGDRSSNGIVYHGTGQHSNRRTERALKIKTIYDEKQEDGE